MPGVQKTRRRGRNPTHQVGKNAVEGVGWRVLESSKKPAGRTRPERFLAAMRVVWRVFIVGSSNRPACGTLRDFSLSIDLAVYSTKWLTHTVYKIPGVQVGDM